MTTQEALAAANVIKDETTQGANTAQRIGTLFVQIMDYIIDIYNKATTFGDKLDLISPTIPIVTANVEKNYDVVDSDYVETLYALTPTGKSYKAILPSASDHVGKKIIFVNKSGSYDMTIEPSGTDKIDYTTSLAFNRLTKVQLIAIDTDNWIVIS